MYNYYKEVYNDLSNFLFDTHLSRDITCTDHVALMH